MHSGFYPVENYLLKLGGQSFNSLETCGARGGPVSPSTFLCRALNTVQGAEPGGGPQVFCVRG